MNLHTIDAIISVIILLFSICLLSISFILPPTGIIHSSALQAVSILGIMTTVFFKLPVIIMTLKNGQFEIKKGDFSASLKKEKETDK